MNRLFMITCSLAIAVVGASGGIVPVPAITTVDHHPRYAYNYAVNDPISHDKKGQWEIRDGGVVKGSYSLVEPDGSVRVVDYYADDHTGFNAVVKKVGPTVHSVSPVPLVAPVLPAVAPIAKLPLIKPTSHVGLYGFGPAPLPLSVTKPASLGHWSLPWDPLTHSFGGWVPLGNPLLGHGLGGPYATIITRKYHKGHLIGTKVTGPLPIRSIIVRKKH
ncbi:larval cuticle protein A3A-like [Pectinophora gossypiella]|uniref:larval cuticle protein A3A-like n=1 Tax=Pectinophora gossypiella TaxID=13191 RepID=UPI00214EC207|nr:larval cuticle protein A3A-like [Pectinophora gossypiella]